MLLLVAAAFISYRREDSAGYAGRLRESIERRLGEAHVFRDVDTLRPGQDVLTPPLEMLNEVIEPTSATAATLVFDLPPSTAKAAIRVSFQNESSELPLDVK
jgi:hypothetical protein